VSPPSPGPLVVAHRGASAREVENSLAAFRAAMQLGADAVELDVHATADGTLVVHHDEAIAGRRIPQLTAQQVAELRLSNGEPIPTLAHVLEAIGPRLQVFVEVKSLPPKFDDRLLEALRRGPNPDAYAVHAFDHRIVRRLGARSPALRRGVLSASYPVRPLVALEDAGATVLWQERTLVDRPLVDALHGGRNAAHRVDRGRAGRHGAAARARRGRDLHEPARDRPPGRGRAGGMTTRRVTVVGAGTMGAGIAYAAALAGFEVCLTDSRAEVLPLALGRLNDLLAVAVKRGKLMAEDHAAAASRLRAEHEFAPAVSGAEVVIEAVHEHLG